MAGATEGQQNRFVHWGERLLRADGHLPESFNCASCHGGMRATGGVAPFNITVYSGEGQGDPVARPR